MADKWIHINELGGDQWVLPIWGAVIQAAEEGRVTPLSTELGELGTHISTRLNFLPRIAGRINQAAAQLYEEASYSNPEHEFSPGVEGVAFDVDEENKYQLLIDIDSLLFELNSVCELMGILFEQLHNHAGKPMSDANIGLSIRSVLVDAGQDPSWFINLDHDRNFFIHKGAPYIAVDISGAPDTYDLLIMKENIKSFDDPDKFVTLSEINEMVRGFLHSRPVIQSYLISLFA